MPLETGPFTQTTFLGASIVNFTASVGWNEQTGNLQVNVVVDPLNGDAFAPPDIGSPVYFEFEDFTFGGLLQSWEKSNSTDGKPTYQIVVVDPREILEGTQLIIDGFNGSVSGIYNLINPYGYHENVAFGNAKVNEGGMPWNLIRSAVLALVGSPSPPASVYGGPCLIFAAAGYIVDFSELPTTPDSYRLGGTSIGLLDAIHQVCQDSGFDFFVTLDFDEDLGNIITIRTASRKDQPTLGSIQAYVDATDGVTSNTTGQELRNEIASAYLVGGQVTQLYQTSKNNTGNLSNDTIVPFWGLDSSGNAIIANNHGAASGTDNFDNQTFTLDARTVNVVGVGATYDTSVIEMRAALAGEDEWRSYIEIANPTLSAAVGITGRFNIGQTATDFILKDTIPHPGFFVNQNKRHAEKANKRNIEEEQASLNVHRLYEYVSAYASEYYGRKFMVRIPDIAAKQDEDTGVVTLNVEPTDGGWAEEGSAPLGLPSIYEDLFSMQDGRFLPFVRFENASGYVLDHFSPDDGLVISNTLYLKVSLEQQLVYLNQSSFTNPRLVVSLPNPILRKVNDPSIKPWFAGLEFAMQTKLRAAGQIEATGVLSTRQKELLAAAVNHGAGGINYFGLAQPAVIPDFVAAPLKSNVLTYGPWYSIGPEGKVRFEKDESLVPWNYGGFDAMNSAGNAKVTESITNMQIGEMGQISFPGAPILQLGDTLESGGPNVTSIDVTVGAQGVTTNYRLRTYTPKFGVFAKSNADKFARQARHAQQVRRSMRQLFRVGNPSSQFFKDRASFFIGNDPKSAGMFKAHSPHGVMVASIIASTGNATKQTLLSSATLYEGVENIQAHDSGYKDSALMSMEGLFRPFTIDTGNNAMGHFVNPTNITDPNCNTLNPFGTGVATHRVKNTDINFATCATGYPDNNEDSLAIANSGWQIETARGIAFKGPLIISGFGYDTDGNPVPNATPSSPGTNFANDYRHKPQDWPTGPLDARWDKERGVWSVGENTSKLYIVVKQVDLIAGYKPMYICRTPISGDRFGQFYYHSDSGAFSSGMNDVFAFNIQENMGDLHTIGVGSPVFLFKVPNTPATINLSGVYSGTDATLLANAGSQTLRYMSEDLRTLITRRLI